MSKRFVSKSRFGFAALFAAALTGCATYQEKDLSPAATQAHFEGRSLHDPQLQSFLSAHAAGAMDEWDLNRLTLAAFYFSPQLELARAQLAESAAGVRSAAALPNPSFTFTPGYNRDAVGGVTPWIVGYVLNIPIELAGKRTYRTTEARQRAEAARLALASAAWSTRSALRRALTDVHAADAMAAYWRDQRPLLAQSVRLVQAQVEAGEVSPLLAAQARIALNRAELAIRENERAVAVARSRLAEAIGIPVASLTEMRLSYRGLAEPVSPVEPLEARGWAAQNRSDLLAALAIYDASQSALQGEIARQYPDLAFGPGYQLDQGEGKWSLSLGVTLPILNQNQGPIATARARREIAAARFLALQNRVLAEVDRAATEYASAMGDLDTVKTMRGSLEQQRRTIQAQQAAGETSRLELTRAQLELADNLRAELEARVRAERALAAFEDAVQRPLAWPESAWRTASQQPETKL